MVTNVTWEQISGSLKQISVGSASQVWGVDANNQIFRYVNNRWEQISSSLKHVSVAADGTVWGVNASDGIYRYLGNNKWEQISGSLKQISVGSASQVWGVNANNQIFRYVNNGWEQISGSLKHVSVAADGTVWGVNANNGIYRYLGNQQWQGISSSLKQISVGSASQVWGVNANNQIFRYVNNRWEQISSSLKHVSVAADGTVWGVNASDQIFRLAGEQKPTTPTAPPATPAPTTPPSLPPIDNTGTIITEPGKTYKVRITVNIPANVGYKNTFGIFAINDDGSVSGVKPSDANYAATVVKNRLSLPGVDEGSYQNGQTFQCDLPGGPKYAVFLIANGTSAQFLANNPQNQGSKPPLAYFFNQAANPDGKSHIKVRSSTEYGFEDKYGGGDQDFDDLIVKLETVSVV